MIMKKSASFQGWAGFCVECVHRLLLVSRPMARGRRTTFAHRARCCLLLHGQSHHFVVLETRKNDGNQVAPFACGFYRRGWRIKSWPWSTASCNIDEQQHNVGLEEPRELVENSARFSAAQAAGSYTTDRPKGGLRAGVGEATALSGGRWREER